VKRDEHQGNPCRAGDEHVPGRRASVHSLTLARAARVVGGPERLSRLLKLSPLQLNRWMRGTEAPPTDVFLRAVDVIETFRP
jgi:hypothetical protein